MGGLTWVHSKLSFFFLGTIQSYMVNILVSLPVLVYFHSIFYYVD